MPSPSSNTRIRSAQTDANVIWSSEVKHFEAEQNRFQTEANKATSATSKKTAQGKADDAAACAAYCRNKVG